MTTTNPLSARIDAFLAQRRIAVAGVARDGQSAGNPIAKRLRSAGYEVFALNPSATVIDGEPSFASISDVPGGIEAVVIATHPDRALSVVQDCVANGVKHVWIHRAFGTGSFSQDAVEACRASDINLIEGACPMMYVKPDIGHKCFRWIMKVSGKLPA